MFLIKQKLKLLFLSLLLLSSFAQAKDEELYFYNWSEYISPEMIKKFQDETGIKVIYSTYESNETMYTKLKTSPDGYDLIGPSNYFVSKMSREHMLQKIDHGRLENFKELDPNYLNKPFDPNNVYSIPFVLGITGIAVNTEMVDKNQFHNWSDLWDPKWKGQLALMDDAREVFHIALVKLGYSPNTTDPKQIKEAYEELKKLLPNVLLFNSDNPSRPYIAQEVGLGMLWNGSAYVAQKEGTPLVIAWPEKGAVFWLDNLSIPSKAKNVDAAYKMIDFLLRPENAAHIAQTIGYPTPVKGAYPLLDPKFRNNPSIYPPQSVIDNGEWQDDVGDATILYETYFQKLKAGL